MSCRGEPIVNIPVLCAVRLAELRRSLVARSDRRHSTRPVRSSCPGRRPPATNDTPSRSNTASRRALRNCSNLSPMTSPAAQPVVAPLTPAAIFLVVRVNPGPEHRAAVRAACGYLAALVRAGGCRDLEGRRSCVVAFGSEAWERLFGSPRPKDLHPFPEIRARHHAVSTPGDILFHIRAVSMDLCFELATQVMSRLGGAVSAVDEVHGFKYFDDRDLIGFVDGTENPVEEGAIDATIIGEEDAAFAGGSYVITHKYLDDVKGWNALPIEQQERIIGRTKLSDIELDNAEK